ncbi:TPA: hypothetical protein ACH3X1_015941 [Trebouxia sp. C0004]
MAYASVSVLSSRTATVQRAASVIHRSLGKHAVRARLPCGCSTHHHTCKKHAVTTARAGRQGPGMPSTGASVQGLAPSVRRARRVASVVRASSAAGEVEESAQGFLGDQDQQKTVYGILAVVWGTIAAAKLFATRQFFDYVFGHAVTNPHVGLLGLQRLAGFSTLAPAVAAYTLARAAKKGRLESETSKRQNLGLAVAGILTLFYLWKTPATVLEPFWQKLAAGLATTTAIVGAVVYGQTSRHKLSLTKIAEGFGTSVANLFSPKNTNAAIYSLLSAGLGVYSLVLLFGSHELAAQWLVLGNDQVSLYLQREIGLSTFLAAIQTYCLKDAADKYKMDGTTYKTLNLSLAAIAAGNASSLWWAVSAASIVTWTTQSYARMVFLALQIITYAYNWIESDREESDDFNRLNDVDPQSELTLRPSPKSDIFSFDISGRTTRNVVDFSISNKTFQAGFHSGELPAPPARKIAIVTCMDARMHPEQFLGLRFGDAHVIRNAGGRISDDALRSLVVSQRMLGTEEVVVIHHTQCGMMTLQNEAVYESVEKRLGREAREHIHDKDYMPIGTDLVASVKRDVQVVKDYPAIPNDTPVHGFIYDVTDGSLKPVVSD